MRELKNSKKTIVSCLFLLPFQGWSSIPHCRRCFLWFPILPMDVHVCVHRIANTGRTRARFVGSVLFRSNLHLFRGATHYLALNQSQLQAKVNGFLAHKTQYHNATAIQQDIYFWAQQTAIFAEVPADVRYAEGFRAYF